MAEEKDHALATASWPEIVQRIRARTPARLLVGRSHPGLRVHQIIKRQLMVSFQFSCATLRHHE